MIITEIKTAPAKVQNEMSSWFLEAAIAMLAGASFKRVFQKHLKTAIGLRKKYCEYWLERSDKEIIYTIDQIINKYPGV